MASIRDFINQKTDEELIEALITYTEMGAGCPCYSQNCDIENTSFSCEEQIKDFFGVKE